MNKGLKSFLKDISITLIVIAVFFFTSLAIADLFDTRSLISPMFVLAVFLVSLFTNGYFYGIFAALMSVLAVNFAFTFPYFSFNFRIYENIISTIILIFVTTATSALITKIKSQEEVRLRAEKEKIRADLLRAVSHDLRTPLTSIYGASSMLLDNFSALSDENKTDILAGIQEDSKWLIRMVENLLSITKIDNSNVKIIKTSVVVEELVDAVLSKLRKNYPDLHVSLTMPEEFLVVLGDALLLEQVLINFLENAVLHAVGMTELRLNVYTRDDEAVFEVIDNGAGIEKEKLKHIFNSYYMQKSETIDDRKNCMGIGLSLCAAIIRAHGGKISAENLKKGGMMFRFSVDLEETEDEQ